MNPSNNNDCAAHQLVRNGAAVTIKGSIDTTGGGKHGGGRPAPLDGGWGWVVLSGVMFVAATLASIAMSFGILFIDPLTTMGVSSTVTAWILNLHSFLFYSLSIFTTPLCETFSWRSVAFTGYALSSVAFMFLALATKPIHIFILFSVFIGISGGISCTVCFLIVPAYFDKLRGTATAAVMIGLSTGMIVVPPLLRYLIDTYSFQGCALIYGAILANCCVASMLYHPLEWHQTRPCEDTSVCVQNICASKVKNVPKKEVSTRKTILKVLKSTMYHLKQFRQLRLAIVTISFSGFLTTCPNFIAQLPLAMAENEFSPTYASWCISIASLSSALFRVFILVASDRPWFSRQYCFTAGMMLGGVSSIVLALTVDNLTWIIVSIVAWAIGSGGVSATYHALLLDICGRELYASGVAVNNLLVAITSIVIGPMFGLIRDLSSYSWSMGACGVLQIVCALIWVLMPYAITRDARINQSDLRK